MMSLLGIDHNDGKFRVVTAKLSPILASVTVVHLKTEQKGVLTCLPEEDSLRRAISRLKSTITHTKDVLKDMGKPLQPKVANYKTRGAK